MAIRSPCAGWARKGKQNGACAALRDRLGAPAGTSRGGVRRRNAGGRRSPGGRAASGVQLHGAAGLWATHAGARQLPCGTARAEDRGGACADASDRHQAPARDQGRRPGGRRGRPAPQDLHAAYNLPAEAPISQTVAIVDSYNDPTAEADLGVYDSEFHLPACTKENGCFKKVNWEGKESSYPANEGGWALEVSLDIETTHAVCPNCKIVLVEAKNETDSQPPDSRERGRSAGRHGDLELLRRPARRRADPSAYNHSGIAIVAATGDYGYLNWETFTSVAGHPTTRLSPHVVAAGGTRLKVEESEWKGETVWNDGWFDGSDRTRRHRRRLQRNAHRAALAAGGPALDGSRLWDQARGGGRRRRRRSLLRRSGLRLDPRTGPAWAPIGGTSLASPIIASVFALAGGSGGVSYPAQTLYEHLGTGALHDIVSGSNGECNLPFNELEGESSCTTEEEAEQCVEELICLAAAGYDGPSGVGTPDGVAAFNRRRRRSRRWNHRRQHRWRA